VAEPEHQAADDDAGEVAAGEFVEAGGDGSPLLEKNLVEKICIRS
jgi:hypothetical protein